MKTTENKWLIPSGKPRSRFMRWLMGRLFFQEVCAWCGPGAKPLRRAWVKPVVTSHGICRECMAKQLDDAKAFNVDAHANERSMAMMNFKWTPEQQAEYERGMMGAVVDPYRASQIQNSRNA